MNITTRSITLKDDFIWVDVVWNQDSGQIFETKSLEWADDSTLFENIALFLGNDCVIEGQVFDLRAQE